LGSSASLIYNCHNMTVNLPLPQKDQLKPIKGFEMGISEAGIKKANRKDLLVMTLVPGSQVAGVFTLNRFCAAPVQVCREHLAQASAKGEICFSGEYWECECGDWRAGYERRLSYLCCTCERVEVEP